MDSGLKTPVVILTGDRNEEEEEEEQDEVSTSTLLTLEPVPLAVDVSQVSSKAREGTSSEPAARGGQSTPPRAAS